MDDSIAAAIADILGRAGQECADVVRRAQRRDDASLAGLEVGVRDAVLRIGQHVMAAALRARQRFEPAPSCAHCGGATVRHEARARTVLTLVGPVAVPCLTFRCGACGRATPGELRAELVHGCTPGFAECVARQGARLAFRQAEQTLHDFGLTASDNLVADLTRAVGGSRIAEQEVEAEAVATGAVELAPVAAPERLYLEADGFRALVSDGGGGRRQQQWHEVRAGACFTTAARRPDAQGRAPLPQHFSCRALWGDCDAFDRWFYPEAQRRGVNVAQEVVLLCDGAPWLMTHLRAYAPPGARVVEILDWYHATENLAKAARARHPADPAAFERAFDQVKAHLWHGRASAVVRTLRAWWRAAPAGGEALRQVIGYLWQNRARMRYPRLRAGGYHIGSGQIESLCKQLGTRVKGADRLWSRDGLAAVLTLRCQMITEGAGLPRAA